MLTFVTINVQPHADRFVVMLNEEYLLDSGGAKITFATAQEAGEAAESVQKAMDTWNAMADGERGAALKAAGTAVPAVAMRHLGYVFPELRNMAENDRSTTRHE